MPDSLRLIVAYILIALIASAVIGTIAWMRYNSHAGRYSRRVRRVQKRRRLF